ncbi:hypothetical protein DL764_005700 [Monosporascus ibericus]|uniref:Inosine/uridine-preferring nucleoside hydrolase domain-containing protein n=1 Tax=Monosporascus ibericus TaxID=155417 RepID=A0A4Q4T894_9PEZI|nr:hypothetical protein DL764_005700 [Monosporascus ibericus]
MSSIQAINSQLNDIKHVIVCVDPVDLDNIWMSLWALGRAPNAHIHITLSPRVLDLRVPTFAELFENLMAKVGSRSMLNVLEKNAEEVYDLLGDESLQDYFARDATFQNDPHTRTHIALYMALSALRFAQKFSSKGHASSRYTFYWDPRSMETIIPGIHHSTHVNDYLYACSDEDRRESNQCLHLRGPEREKKMVAIMERTANRLAEQLGYQKPADILHPIEELIKLFKGPVAGTQSLVLGGGPFTEMVRLLAETGLVPLAIVAMARTWYADVNIFANNYNDLMDLDAAMEIEKIAKKRAIPTWFFPTECAKAKVQDGKVLRACPWDFATEKLITIFEDAGDMESYEQAGAFTRETMTLAKIHMFDVLTVVPLALPSSLPYRRAESYWDQVKEQRVIRIKEAPDGPINVFYPDKEAMEASKQMAMKEISYVLSPVRGN